MYEFTNGIVVFDEKTRDRYIQAGYKLAGEKSQEQPVEINEELNENVSNDGTIKRQSKKRNKLSK